MVVGAWIISERLFLVKIHRSWKVGPKLWWSWGTVKRPKKSRGVWWNDTCKHAMVKRCQTCCFFLRGWWSLCSKEHSYWACEPYYQLDDHPVVQWTSNQHHESRPMALHKTVQSCQQFSMKQANPALSAYGVPAKFRMTLACFAIS